MKKNRNFKIIYAFAALLLMGCGGSPLISTPIENIDTSPLKVAELTKEEKENWGHLDLEKDTIPGMGVDRAYAEIIKGKKGKKVIVAVIDSGIDIDHEDLDGVIWTNKDEIPNNGKDDDKNGYVDDMHGWNFLGDAYNEQLEYVRIIAAGDKSAPRYAEAEKLHAEEYQTWLGRKTQYEQIYQQVLNNDEILSKHLGKKDYTKEDVNGIKSSDASVQGAVQFANFIYSNGIESMADAKKELADALESINDRVNYNLKKDFKGRTTGDNPDDFNDKPGYGNGNVKPVKKSESHGTHVAGIIAAERNNGKGANGVANNVEIMSIRAVPNGDEYDKDVAKAIRYAVDNGAKVINGSFGKSFSPHSDWVRDAIKYAADNDVLIVHAAGNDSKDIDIEPNFPADNINGQEVANNYISVGALGPKYGSKMVASFSNYGDQNVDIFAPGAQVYSTTPENEYDTKGGTSMAAPAVAGLAALIRSYYPKLTAAQVKDVILKSGLQLTTKVIVGGDAENVQPFTSLSKSGRIANAYNALIMASKL
ncbi:subtilase family protein [Winogradskyella wandonensis]|uniref:Subtilase family protein n=1 Tax=Winogradskyella wandonensis TaxID=1442586 RepID=A0A4R1KS55_9FLAO|nr:S8 family peptidase [Winogradskyella wandonensis]TCK67862.1 subtilase family protein [Winogradskyella wandonensis]